MGARLVSEVCTRCERRPRFAFLLRGPCRVWGGALHGGFVISQSGKFWGAPRRGCSSWTNISVIEAAVLCVERQVSPSQERTCGRCWANLEGSVALLRSLFSPGEREQGPTRIRRESLARIRGHCSLDQKGCFSELWFFVVVVKASFQLLLRVWSSS